MRKFLFAYNIETEDGDTLKANAIMQLNIIPVDTGGYLDVQATERILLAEVVKQLPTASLIAINNIVEVPKLQ